MILHEGAVCNENNTYTYQLRWKERTETANEPHGLATMCLRSDIGTMPLAALSTPLRRLLWVSLACWSCFVVERFFYNVFDLGAPYNRVPTMFLWLLLMPFAGYWFVLTRTSLLRASRCAVRVAALGGASFALAVGFL